MNMGYKVIITGATGMVGEGVLLECLDDPQISEVLSVSRRPLGMTHSKLKEYNLPDFLGLQAGDPMLKGYDACFYCAGVSSVGMNEEKYNHITYDTTIHFAKVLVGQNPQMVFTFVSGKSTDSSEKGGVMWARVKGKTENTLAAMPFRKVHNFRPGMIKATKGQKNTLKLYDYLSWMYPIIKTLFPNAACTAKQIGMAMIKCVTRGCDKQTLEVPDIIALAEK